MFVFTNSEVIQRFIAALFRMLPEQVATRPLKYIIWLNWSCNRLTQQSGVIPVHIVFNGYVISFQSREMTSQANITVSLWVHLLTKITMTLKWFHIHISYSDHVRTSWVQNELRMNLTFMLKSFEGNTIIEIVMLLVDQIVELQLCEQ